MTADFLSEVLQTTRYRKTSLQCCVGEGGHYQSKILCLVNVLFKNNSKIRLLQANRAEKRILLIANRPTL